jgi:hypothetical protein
LPAFVDCSEPNRSMDTENWKFRYFWITFSGIAPCGKVSAVPCSCITAAVRSTTRCTPVVPTNMWWAFSLSMNSQVRASGSKADSFSVPSWYLPSRSVK